MSLPFRAQRPSMRGPRLSHRRTPPPPLSLSQQRQALHRRVSRRTAGISWVRIRIAWLGGMATEVRLEARQLPFMVPWERVPRPAVTARRALPCPFADRRNRVMRLLATVRTVPLSRHMAVWAQQLLGAKLKVLLCFMVSLQPSTKHMVAVALASFVLASAEPSHAVVTSLLVTGTKLLPQSLDRFSSDCLAMPSGAPGAHPSYPGQPMYPPQPAGPYTDAPPSSTWA
jgi:hypothetical protein